MKGYEWVKAKTESQQFSDCKYLEYHLMNSDLLDDDGYPTDAENHLRALMLKAALSVASSAYTDAEVGQIVDEVLNGK